MKSQSSPFGTLALSVGLVVAATGTAAARHGHAPVTLDSNGLHVEAPNISGTAVVKVTDSASEPAKKWSATIFRSPARDPRMEADAQWIFIVKLEIQERELIVTDERDRRFAVNLDTHRVRLMRRTPTKNEGHRP